MIVLKTACEIQAMRQAGRIAAGALQAGLAAVKPGVSTLDVNRIIHNYITSKGATPSFLGYGGFPAAACISINDQVIHGIPSDKVIIREGDLVKLDVGAVYNGFHGDNAATVAAGQPSEEARKLMEVTKECLAQGIAAIKPGGRIGDIANAVQSYAEANGCGVVRHFVGHGIGTKLHEEPEVPNYGKAGRGPRLLPGTVIAIEPMINAGTWDIKQLNDGWTIVTADGSLSAHFEHTVAITENGPEILTAL